MEGALIVYALAAAVVWIPLDAARWLNNERALPGETIHGLVPILGAILWPASLLWIAVRVAL